jgi:hypothetical protein
MPYTYLNITIENCSSTISNDSQQTTDPIAVFTLLNIGNILSIWHYSHH